VPRGFPLFSLLPSSRRPDAQFISGSWNAVLGSVRVQFHRGTTCIYLSFCRRSNCLRLSVRMTFLRRGSISGRRTQECQRHHFSGGGNGLSVQSSVGGQRHHFSGGRYGLSVQSSVRMTREVEFFLDLPMLRPWGAQHFKLVSFSLVVTVLRSEVTSPTGTWAAGSVGEGCGGWRGETVSRVIWRGETVSRVICYCCLAIHTQGLRNLGVYGR
jgi:hypothetical protein